MYPKSALIAGARARSRQGGFAPVGRNVAEAKAPPGAGPENSAWVKAPPGAGPENLAGAKAPP